MKALTMGALLATLSVAPLTTAASAQQQGWSHEATAYLFMPDLKASVETPERTVEGELSFSDAFKNLDAVFMATYSASKGPWTLFADFNFTDLSFENDTPELETSELQTSLRARYITGYAAYRVAETASVKVDVAGGVRWFATDAEFTFTPGTAPGGSTRVDNSWFDPLIAARLRYAFSPKWSATGFFDYGGFRSNSETWQVLLTADYAINDRWLIRGGYRYISFEHDTKGSTFKMDQSGPLLGATYRF